MSREEEEKQNTAKQPRNSTEETPPIKKKRTKAPQQNQFLDLVGSKKYVDKTLLFEA
jgi:hypothetical protein